MCTVPVKVSVGWREAVSGLCDARMSCMVPDVVADCLIVD